MRAGERQGQTLRVHLYLGKRRSELPVKETEKQEGNQNEEVSLKLRKGKIKKKW